MTSLDRRANPGANPALLASCLGMATYAASATITPISLVVVAHELGLNLTEAGGLEVARSTLITAVLLASPWVAAWRGKAWSLGWSSVVMGLGLVAYGLAPGYGAVLLALALVGVGGGVLEGLINPLVQDVGGKSAARWLNAVNGFWSVGVLVTMLGGGEWLTRGGDWRVPMLLLGGLSVGTGAAFLRAHRALPREPSVGAGEVWARARAVVRAPHFAAFAGMMLFAGGAEGAFTFWSASLVQLEFGGNPRAGGLVTACFAAGMIAGRFAAGIWLRQHSLWAAVFGSAVAGALVAAVLPLLGSITQLAVGMGVAGVCVACFWPSIQAYAAGRVSDDVTELFILLSVAGIPGFAGASWALGALADVVGLRTAFWAVPGLFVGLAGLLLWERRVELRGAR
jgi:fucose permease